jgi:predicted CXXCH cytochrome family protein
MPSARFNHKSHAQAKCADCHDVAGSKKSSDVAMPTIKACRECHGGSRPAEGKVMSNCMLCHGFHDARYPWDPSFTPKERAHATRKTADAR